MNPTSLQACIGVGVVLPQRKGYLRAAHENYRAPQFRVPHHTLQQQPLCTCLSVRPGLFYALDRLLRLVAQVRLWSSKIHALLSQRTAIP